MSLSSKFLKIISVTIVCIACVLPVSAQSRHEKTFGIHTGYVSRNRSADIGLFFQYSFSSYFRLQPSADIVFRHHNRDAFLFDINGQVPINLAGDNFSLYPFAGLNFSSWNKHNEIPNLPDVLAPGDFDTEKNHRYNYFGVNLGAGFDLKLSSTLKLSIEAGYTFVKGNSGLRALAGIGYIF